MTGETSSHWKGVPISTTMDRDTRQNEHSLKPLEGRPLTFGTGVERIGDESLTRDDSGFVHGKMCPFR